MSAVFEICNDVWVEVIPGYLAFREDLLSPDMWMTREEVEKEYELDADRDCIYSEGCDHKLHDLFPESYDEIMTEWNRDFS